MRVFETEQYLMGTSVKVKVIADIPKVDGDNALSSAINEFHKVVARFTRFNDSSELAILNRHGGDFYEVSDELFTLVEFGITLGKRTAGIFDITVIDFLEKYGYGKEVNISVDDNIRKEISHLASTRHSLEEIQLDKKNKRIKLLERQMIDLGGIGKGYAIENAKNTLISKGIENFLINAGGDINAHGRNIEKDRDWVASLFNPIDSTNGVSRSFGGVNLRNQALACSGGYARKVGEFHHLINPKNGQPENSFLQSFVIGENAMITDALATVLYLMGENAGKILDEYDCSGMLVKQNGEIVNLNTPPAPSFSK